MGMVRILTPESFKLLVVALISNTPVLVLVHYCDQEMGPYGPPLCASYSLVLHHWPEN